MRARTVQAGDAVLLTLSPSAAGRRLRFRAF